MFRAQELRGRIESLIILVFVCATTSSARDVKKPQSASEPKSVTAPVTIDHNRILVDADLTLPDGSTSRVRTWIDTGNPDFEMSRRVATLLALNVTCNDNACSAPPPREIVIGGMKISLAAVKQAQIPLVPVSAQSVMEPGMAAEINLPSSVLRNFEVIIDFPARRATIGQPGSLKFKGASAKVSVNANNGLIQVPAQIEKKKYNLALDLGASISLLSQNVLDQLSSSHPDWPQLTGAAGPANMWGLADESTAKLMRIDRIQYGPLYLTNVAVVEFPKDRLAYFEKRAGIATAGLLGSQALLNYRVGIDYARSTVYFDLGRTFIFPDFDVVGLILRPEDDGRFTILGVADANGKPSVQDVQANDHLVAVDGIPVRGSTMGQVWSMLGGTPGKERKLTIERSGREFDVSAPIRHFLPVQGENDDKPAPMK